MTDTGTRETEAVVEIQRDIQREVAADDRQEEERRPTAVQAGARPYPVPPFPSSIREAGCRVEARPTSDL